jgi:uncharacterized phosphatase
MKQVIFIRHGESIANAEDWVAGRTDVELTGLGREQAKKAAQKVIADGKKVGIIIASPLKRARETAEIIAREIGYPISKIQIDLNLIELETGKWTRGTHQKLSDDMLSGVFPDGYKEEIAIHGRSIIEKLRSIPEQNIMLVGHGGAGRMMLQLIKDPDHYLEDTKQPRLKNCDPIYVKI